MVVQSVGTDGRVFQFLVLQLNTTDLASSEGIKNLAWVDSDQLLYRHFWCRPVIKKKVVVVSPASSSLVITAGLDLSIQREPRLGLLWPEGLWEPNTHICLPFSSVPAVGDRLSLCPPPPASVPWWTLLRHSHVAARWLALNLPEGRLGSAGVTVSHRDLLLYLSLLPAGLS